MVDHKSKIGAVQRFVGGNVIGVGIEARKSGAKKIEDEAGVTGRDGERDWVEK